ncbi:polysaccharide deacetylase family protein [Candidatus Saccharibacteria bacterium]|nr:polysaccharide deacetylase family protein [Candidatus Saccharibacteria bacterium]
MRIKRRRLLVRHGLMGVLVFTFILTVIILVATSISERYALSAAPSIHEEYCNKIDFGPEITLNGEAEVAVVQGQEYQEPGFLVDDFCELKSTETIGQVDTASPGEYEITYRATSGRGATAEAKRIVRVLPSNRGVVYLTFDDGPGPYTAELLDVLAKYNVKATFFVTGAGEDELILREYTEGHTVGLHTMSHDYAYIYANMDNYFEDLYAVQARVKNITGETVTLMRFPGGSSNLVSARYDGGTRIMTQLTSEVEKRGFTYFDWNISSGDAGQTTSAGQVFENVVTALKEGGTSVVLQHDIKEYSVAAVEAIIKYGLENGWVFAKLDANSFSVHHGVNN